LALRSEGFGGISLIESAPRGAIGGSHGGDEHSVFPHTGTRGVGARHPQNIAACNAEVEHLNQLRAACQQAIDGKWPEGPMWERFHRYRVAVIASREKAARLR